MVIFEFPNTLHSNKWEDMEVTNIGCGVFCSNGRPRSLQHLASLHLGAKIQEGEHNSVRLFSDSIFFILFSCVVVLSLSLNLFPDGRVSFGRLCRDLDLFQICFYSNVNCVLPLRSSCTFELRVQFFKIL